MQVSETLISKVYDFSFINYLARYWISSDNLRNRFPERFNAVSGEKSYIRDVMCLAPIPDRSRLSCSSISSSTVSTSNCDLELANRFWYYKDIHELLLKNVRRVPRKLPVHATSFDNCLRVFGNVALAFNGVVLVPLKRLTRREYCFLGSIVKLSRHECRKLPHSATSF